MRGLSLVGWLGAFLTGWRRAPRRRRSTRMRGSTYRPTVEGLETRAVPNAAPVVSNISGVSVLHGQWVVVDLSTAASDADNDPLTYAVTCDPTHGSVDLDPSTGHVVYAAYGDYSGSDSFTFKANDGELDSNTAAVSISVTNQAPVATNFNESVEEGQWAIIDLAAHASDADSDALMFSFVSSPSHGSADLDPYTGQVIYTPYSDYSGPDSFTFRANDGAIDSNTAMVSITVTGLPLVVPALAYDVPTSQGMHANVGVGLLNHLYDVNASYSLASLTVGGSSFSPGQTITFDSGALLTVASDGSFTFVPATDYTGTESFSFTVSANGQTATATAQFYIGTGYGVDSSSVSFTDSGTLKYNRATADFEEESTVEQVPFSLGVGIPLVVFPTLSIRLPVVNSDATYTFPGEDQQRTLQSQLRNFMLLGGQAVVTQAVHVRIDLKVAIQDLAAVLNAESGDPLPRGVGRWFRGPDYLESERYSVLQDVKETYETVAEGLDENRTSYYDDPTDTGYGQSPAADLSDVGIGQLFWIGQQGTNLAKDRYGTIIHELYHCYTGSLVDHGYFNNPGALQDEDNPVQWYQDAMGNQPVANPLTTGQLLTNPDSYSGYLLQYYYHW